MIEEELSSLALLNSERFIFETVNGDVILNNFKKQLQLQLFSMIIKCIFF